MKNTQIVRTLVTIYRILELMKHSKSRLVEDADESAPVRLKTAPTGPDN